MIIKWIMENKVSLATFTLMLGLTALLLFLPEFSFAQMGGSGFESKVQNINNNLITRILPLVSIFGIFYAAVLAISGDGEAKGKIIGVLFASAMGFLAPMIIEWLKGLAL